MLTIHQVNPNTGERHFIRGCTNNLIVQLQNLLHTKQKFISQWQKRKCIYSMVKLRECGKTIQRQVHFKFWNYNLVATELKHYVTKVDCIFHKMTFSTTLPTSVDGAASNSRLSVCCRKAHLLLKKYWLKHFSIQGKANLITKIYLVYAMWKTWLRFLR